MACGLVPLAAFLAGTPRPLLISIVSTGLVFLVIGGLRGRFSLGSSWRTAAETLAIGAVAGLVAWMASAFGDFSG